MTEDTRKYRKSQFRSILGHDCKYNPTIKINTENGSTNFMDITATELQLIIMLLTK